MRQKAELTFPIIVLDRSWLEMTIFVADTNFRIGLLVDYIGLE